MSEPPAKLGLRVLRDRPSLIASEIAWRWIVGVFALALTYVVSRRFAQALVISPETEAMLASGDVQQAVVALTEVLTAALPVLARIALITIPVLAVLWTFAVTIGRASILPTLLKQCGANPHPTRATAATLFMLHAFRVLSLVILVIGYLIAGGVSSRFVANSADPNIVAAVLVFLLVFVIAYAAWSVVHFVLALAPIFVVRDASGTARSLGEALDFTCVHAAKLFAIASANGTLRFIAAFVIAALGLVPLFAAGAIPVSLIIAFEIVISLIYCAISDALLLARLAGYVALISSESRSSMASGM